MIKAVIVDDEPYCCETLSTLLASYCPQVKVIDVCYTAREALECINKNKPEIVFLDIEMPHMNGFEMLERLQIIEFKVIFTTSYDQYALKAIHFSALEYLLKPVDKDELQKAVEKAISSGNLLPQQIEILFQKLRLPVIPVNKIAVPTMEGLEMIFAESIICCRADSNYTILLLKDKQKLVASRTLKDIEEILEDFSFVRVHHSFLINLNEVEKYVKGEGGYLLMSDGTTVDVSRSRRDFLLKKLSGEGRTRN